MDHGPTLAVRSTREAVMPSNTVPILERRLTRYVGFTIWICLTLFLITAGNAVLAGVVSPPLLVLWWWSTLRKQVCHACGFTIRSSDRQISHCMKCGTLLAVGPDEDRHQNTSIDVELGESMK